MSVMSVTSAVLANSLLKQILLLNLSVPIMQLIPVSNFVSDWQSVKPVHKLINVNRKHPHEELVTNKDNCQHDFTKPISVMNILMISIYFWMN